MKNLFQHAVLVLCVSWFDTTLGGQIGPDQASNGGTDDQPRLAVSMYAGLSIAGLIGKTYTLQWKSELGPTNQWFDLTTLTLSNTVQLWFDLDSPKAARRYYRVVESINLTELGFDNSRNPLGYFYGSTNELGDQISLGGGGGALTQFKFEYYLSHNATGTEQAQLTLYDTSGPRGAPGLPLFVSDPFKLESGYNTVTLSNVQISVPASLIWTVHFTGISENESAGLIFENPPNVGSSFDDFWMRKGSIWDVYWFDLLIDINHFDWLVSNFGAQVTLLKYPSVPDNSSNAKITIAPGLIGGLDYTPLLPPSPPSSEPIEGERTRPPINP